MGITIQIFALFATVAILHQTINKQNDDHCILIPFKDYSPKPIYEDKDMQYIGPRTDKDRFRSFCARAVSFVAVQWI